MLMLVSDLSDLRDLRDSVFVLCLLVLVVCGVWEDVFSSVFVRTWRIFVSVLTAPLHVCDFCALLVLNRMFSSLSLLVSHFLLAVSFPYPFRAPFLRVLEVFGSVV